ncbi:hypothetical protein LAUMK40_01446 [Mycobacterium kansasii]|nr:hypothetical protein LAUMK40_01446 [Mycobacterium kansasii]
MSATQDKRDSDAILSRLKRDDPELAEKVITGQTTANAAALEKGWRKPRIVLRCGCRRFRLWVAAFAAVLTEHLAILVNPYICKG